MKKLLLTPMTFASPGLAISNAFPVIAYMTIGHSWQTAKLKYGAGDETRTRDIFLGKEVLYQLSYTRVFLKRRENDPQEGARIKNYLRRVT
jgi:hypothetical protein